MGYSARSPVLSGLTSRVTQVVNDRKRAAAASKKSASTPRPAPVRDPRLQKRSPGVSPANAATPNPDPLNERFGNDLSFLDPIFQQNPALLGDSQISKSYADPAAIDAQKQALGQLFGIANGGGATDIERARMAQARNENEDWLKGQRDADMQNLAERGMAGSGAQLADLAMDRQAAGNRLSNAGLQTQAMLQQRAMDAILHGGDLAGQMRGSSFDEAKTRAAGADAFAVANNNTINSVAGANKQFLQNAWQNTINNRQAWDTNKLNNGLSVAGGLMSSDVGQNNAGYANATGVAGQSAGQSNSAKQDYNATITNPATNGLAQSQNFGASSDSDWENYIKGIGTTMDSAGNFGAKASGGGFPGGKSGGGGF